MPQAHVAQAQGVIRNIQVEGNQRIQASTIASIADLPAGQRVTGGQINAAVQNLYESGLFETVDVQQRGSTLVIFGVYAGNPSAPRQVT